MTTQEKIRGILVDQLGIDEAEVVSNASLANDLGADSLDYVEIVMALEEEFEIEMISDEDAEQFLSTQVQAMYDYVERRVKKAS